MAKPSPQYWLMKSEPDQFGIDDLQRVGVEPWSGVRNYMARAHMRAMQVGDGVLFHHSNAVPPGVAGLARVVRIGVLDQTQFDPASPYHDPRATADKPVWDCVDVEFVGKLPHYVSMDRMRGDPELAEMLVLRRGMRLSVQPVSGAHYARVIALGDIEPPPPPPKPPRVAKPKPPVKAKAKAKPPGKATAKAKPRATAKRR